MKSILRLRATLLLMLLTGCGASNTDTDDLTAILHEFLAGVSEEAVHDRFWAEDLIYTSSRGTRTNKAEIMQEFGSAEGGETEESEPVYTAEDIRIQVYGTTAVVAFRLVATAADDAAVDYYFNTGTFVKRNGVWQVVAWQATKIPGM
ncbi:MAG: nuclear transport factor 2 family protein [Proteobacteria bacterium]|nr:nuclear transport factor 2 family protein [Pseudomonadota bacterium]